ncbi:unnamed protein product [Allacma fusca]|uniref:Uncharacterized protein n=1 Tax=Allacma fusca TaxID=39272 RepID=A0A8J2L972_9HEXA|nr:unnamed protein product [Allacma fusca]
MLYPDTGLQDYNVGSYAAPDPVTTYSITYSEEYDEPILSQSVPRKGIPISTLDTSINSSLIPLDTDFAKCESTQSRKKGPRKLSYQERKQRAFVVYAKSLERRFPNPQQAFVYW